VTFYSTLAAGQIGYIAGDCDARIAVLDGAQELARWQPVPASTVRAAAACPADDQNPPPRPLPRHVSGRLGGPPNMHEPRA
jgi:hypothetical protein